MRPRNRACIAVAAAALVIVVGAADSDASGWRSTRYGRSGAEIWFEVPRFAFATGGGYKDDYDLDSGMGVGFGIMFGVSDNIAFEVRLLQTNHEEPVNERAWDLDIVEFGARYTFLHEFRLQPFVGAGAARVALEHDFDSDDYDFFERVSGWGYYATAGVDFIWSSSWSLFFRADYVMADYSRGYLAEGGESDEGDLPERLEADSFAVTLGVAYRIPMW